MYRNQPRHGKILRRHEALEEEACTVLKQVGPERAQWVNLRCFAALESKAVLRLLSQKPKKAVWLAQGQFSACTQSIPIRGAIPIKGACPNRNLQAFITRSNTQTRAQGRKRPPQAQ